MDLIFPKKIKELDKALKTLEEVAFTDDYEHNISRDLRVLRFLYTAELFQKVLKYFLRENLKIETKFPADVYRKARSSEIISDEDTETLLNMIDDRNFCAHAYQEYVVEKISQKVPLYTTLMRKIYITIHKF